jgi:hypothetical protein
MKIIDKLAKTDGTTLTFSKLPDGKFKATCQLWTDGATILPDRVLEVRSVQGTIRIARKIRERDEQDLPRTIEDAIAQGDYDPLTRSIRLPATRCQSIR